MASRFTEQEALNQSGELYRHKKGGIYKLVEVTTLRDSGTEWKGEKDHKKGETLATYRHLWPHDHAYYQRPHAEFIQPDRFAKIVRLQG